jgi:hypothetical protein
LAGVVDAGFEGEVAGVDADATVGLAFDAELAAEEAAPAEAAAPVEAGTVPGTR